MALISSFCIFFLVAHFATPIVCIRNPINQTPALFVFSDSIFDPGNNNYINTTTNFQENYLPYGESFFKYPTGRNSDGRLIPDFIGIFICVFPNCLKSINCGRPEHNCWLYFAAEYAKLPFIPPYFEIGKKHLVHRVKFASGGSGCLAETARGFVSHNISF